MSSQFVMIYWFTYACIYKTFYPDSLWPLVSQYSKKQQYKIQSFLRRAAFLLKHPFNFDWWFHKNLYSNHDYIQDYLLNSYYVNVWHVYCRPKADNSELCLKLIDFGRSIDMTLLPEDTTFTTVVTTDGFQCNEMKEGRPWTYQVNTSIWFFCVWSGFGVLQSLL